MIFENENKVNRFNFQGIEKLTEKIVKKVYESQALIQGEYFLLIESVLNKKLSKEDVQVILKFYCETEITTPKENRSYSEIRNTMWNSYHSNGTNSKEYRESKRKFEALDSKLTATGRLNAIKAIVKGKEITRFKNLYTNAPDYEFIEDILDEIRNKKQKFLIDSIRKSDNKEEKAKLKKKLPVVLFNGFFYKRNGDKFIKFSNYMCLDFDGLDSEVDVEIAKKKLIKDSYVFAVFISPKGMGLKVLIKVKRENTKDHLELFNGAKEHFNYIPGFDDACKDLARACYLSSDPDLYHNKDSEFFNIKAKHEIVKSKNKKQKSTINNMELDLKLLLREANKESDSIFNESDAEEIKKLVFKWWKSKYKLTEGERNNNLYKLAIKLFCSGVDENEILKFFKLKFKNVFEDDDELASIVSSACKNQSNFNSSPWINYSFKNEIIKLLDSSSDDEINKLLESKGIDYNSPHIVDELSELYTQNQRFWFEIKSKDGFVTSYNINHIGLVEFLKSQNIFCLNKGKAFSYFVVKGNIITEIDIFGVKNLIISYIKKTRGNNEKLINSFLKQKSIFSDLFLSDLLVDEIKTNRDTKLKAYKYFRNGVLIIEKEVKNTLIDYENLETPIYETQIIQRDFKLNNKDKTDFEIFINDVAGINLESFKSAIGYLCVNYKSQSNAKAIILNDPSTSYLEAQGGKGKGVFGKSISLFSNVVRIDGKKYRSDDTFNLAPVTLDSEVVFIDDLKQGFKFTDLFNVITDDLEVTKKYGDKFTIPFSVAPKLLLATNYPLTNASDQSSLRRSFHLIFEDYYSTSKTPMDKFGKEFFTGWNDNEWSAFYVFMADCVKLYLENGLIPMKLDTQMKLKELIGNTSEDFLAFMTDKETEFKDTSFSLTDIKQEYYHYSNYNISARKLKTWIKKWCDFYDYKLVENRVNNKRLLKISKYVFYLENFNKKNVA